ncbi:MAG: carbon-nitrogen family hydrolase [bacterium]
MSVKDGDERANFDSAEAALSKASPKSGSLVVLPELFHCGYDWSFIRGLTEADTARTISRLSDCAKRHSVFLIAGSIAEARGDQKFNTSFVFDPDGNQIARYSKAHLFSLFEEDRHICAGNSAVCVECGKANVGLMICYDMRFPEHARRLAIDGAQILAVPSVWPLKRRHAWRTLAIARAIEQQCAVIAVNRAGIDSTGADYGASLIVDSWGNVLAESEGSNEDTIEAEISLDEVAKSRSHIPTFGERRPDVYRLDWELCNINALQ